MDYPLPAFKPVSTTPARAARLPLLMLLIFTAVLSGCSSSGSTKVSVDQQERIPPGSTLEILVEPDPKIADEEDATKALAELRSQLFGRAMSSGRFASVVASGQPADYSLKVKLTGAREVSTAARLILGTFAGSNSLVAEVEFYRNQPKELLESFTSTADSAAHWASSQNSMADAMRELVDEIEKGFQG